MIKGRDMKGFTLIEMLIVVALIAILVAISIPLVGKALQRSQVATDMANERGCKAAITTRLASKTNAFEGIADPTPADAYYDAVAGKLIDSVPTAKYGKCKAHENGYLKASYDSTDDKYIIEWAGTTSVGVHKAEGETSDCTDKLDIKPGD